MIGSLDCVSVFNDVKCTVARPLPSMIPIRAACFQRVPWIVGGRYRYLVHLTSYLTQFQHSLFYVVAYASDSVGECDSRHCSLLTGSTSTLQWAELAQLSLCCCCLCCMACQLAQAVCKSRGLALGLSPKHQCRRWPMTHADCLRQQFPEQSRFS